ncbi:hypothetical protein [Chitinophaga sp. S165]|uniref:hypothetical protein n=1 Tax=Chitinophaga sp. S165 TaxID=2135462 RepID=UPI000D70B0A2|nr:hypothetical protein [Chitinophaga sp. S165]PWV56457.1 hypothetical protein C7475_101973 [Chitinophaga sp. S165]
MTHEIVIELPLLTVKKNFAIRLLTWIVFISFPLLFLSLIFWSGKITLIFFILFAASAIPVQIVRLYEIVGKIKLTNKEIIVDSEQEQLSFLLSTVTNVGFNLLGVQGEFNQGRSFIMNQGATNFLQFRYGGEKKEYRFLVKEESVNDLKSLLRAWKEANISYSLYNMSWKRFPRT